MALMLKGARCIDPQVGLDEVCDILIRDGKIAGVGHDLVMEKGVTRDLTGKVLVLTAASRRSVRCLILTL